MKRIQTKVRGRWIVSTVGVGPFDDDGHGGTPLHPYETAVLDIHAPAPEWRRVAHYPTPETARHGHNRVVTHLKGGGQPTYI